MDEVLGQRHSTVPTVLIASIPEDQAGPSEAVGNQEEEEEEDEDRGCAITAHQGRYEVVERDKSQVFYFLFYHCSSKQHEKTV